jgi:hypothetical protein
VLRWWSYRRREKRQRVSNSKKPWRESFYRQAAKSAKDLQKNELRPFGEAVDHLGFKPIP